MEKEDKILETRILIIVIIRFWNSTAIKNLIFIEPIHSMNNKAIYKNSDFNSSCKIIFSFFRQGIRVEEFADDYNSSCGFGHSVVVEGFFKKKSNKIPTIKELTDE